jgi:hypothetical protein
MELKIGDRDESRDIEILRRFRWMGVGDYLLRLDQDQHMTMCFGVVYSRERSHNDGTNPENNACERLLVVHGSYYNK